jgi:predicted Zn-dependent protease
VSQRIALQGFALALAAFAALGGCASTAPGGRAQVTMPTSLSAVYSSVDMNMQLGSAASIAEPCVGVQCQLNAGFDKQVQRIGARLAQSAYDTYPDLKQRVPRFEFVVAEKSQPGSASNASGTIVVYRGVRNGKLDEEVLAFVMAREMGHVVARHHDEKSAAGILFSLVAQVFLPVVNVTRGIATLAGSAASMVGSDAVTRDKAADHDLEARRVALELLGRQGWAAADLAEPLAAYTQGLHDDPWSAGIRDAAAHCARERLIAALARLPAPGADAGKAEEAPSLRPAIARAEAAAPWMVVEPDLPPIAR